MKRKHEENQTENTISPFSKNLEEDIDLVLSNDQFGQKISYELKKIGRFNKITNSDKLNSVSEYPTPYIFAKFSSIGYENYDEKPLEKSIKKICPRVGIY